MRNYNTRLRLEDAELMATSLKDLLYVCMCHVDSIEDSDIKSILHIACNVANGISQEIEISVNELIEAKE